jgi:hypothetical protein|tara:strand:- start:1226 stop:1651 length:426 start_codon:yes stop_codon:yes gene_type:complete
MKDGVAEVIMKASKIKSEKDRMVFLQNSTKTCEPLLTVFNLLFNKDISFDLPEGDPPYTPLPKESDMQNYLYSEFRKIRYFIKGQEKGLTHHKRETLFIEFLESMDPDDAKLLLAIKDKKSPYKGITKNLIKKTFRAAKDW